MKFKITFIILSLLAINVAFAQSMKAPVSFKLKNGITVIVAQNEGMGKIYSRLTIENKSSEAQRNIAQVFESFLNGKAVTFNQNVAQNDSETTPKVSLTVDEVNTATNVADFQQALQFVSDNILNPELSQQAFEVIKSNTDLANVTLADVKAFYANHFKPSDTFITIAGDIDPATAKAMANKVFGNWKTERAAL